MAVHESRDHSAEIEMLLPHDPREAIEMLIELAGGLVDKAHSEMVREAAEAVNVAAERGANEAINRVVAWLGERAYKSEMGDLTEQARLIRRLADEIGRECRP